MHELIAYHIPEAVRIQVIRVSGLRILFSMDLIAQWL